VGDVGSRDIELGWSEAQQRCFAGM
jgi:hypothetical protein